MSEPLILPGTGWWRREDADGGGEPHSATHAAPPLHHPTDGPPPRAGEDRFTAAATKLAGAAGVMFGWAPEQFWRATPAELGALIDALKGEAGAEAADAATLDRLKEQFPDG